MNTTKAASKKPGTYTKTVATDRAKEVSVHHAPCLISTEVVYEFGLIGLVTETVRLAMAETPYNGQVFLWGVLQSKSTGEVHYIVTEDATPFVLSEL